MSPVAVIALGMLIGIAAVNLVLSLPIMRRPSLEDRLAPYMRESETVGRMYSCLLYTSDAADDTR